MFVVAALAIVAMLATTGCIRLELNVIVHDAGEGELNGRLTVSPLLIDLLGGVEGLEAAFMEESAYETEIRRVSDSDDWRGIAFKAIVPPDEAFADLGPEFTLQRTESGWRFSSQDANPFADAPSALGFRFRFSITLPGELESSNGDSTETRGGMTTARWEITDPTTPVDFYLATDTSRVADGGGLGTGAIAGIVIAATVAAGLGLIGWLRLSSRSGQPTDESEGDTPSPETDP